jgi:hypothetical protein
MQGTYHGGLIYLKSKLDTTKVKDAPSFCDKSMLLKK